MGLAENGRGGGKTTGFWWGSLKERDNFEDLGINGRTILKLILKKELGGWGLDQSGSGQGYLRALLNAVINLLVS